MARELEYMIYNKNNLNLTVIFRFSGKSRI